MEIIKILRVNVAVFIIGPRTDVGIDVNDGARRLISDDAKIELDEGSAARVSSVKRQSTSSILSLLTAYMKSSAKVAVMMSCIF